MGIKVITKFLFLAGIILLFSSCDRDRDHPGWDIFPGMFYSFAYETWSPNPVFEDGKTMRNPVEGTVTRDYIPFKYTLDEREKAGEELENPLVPDDRILERGRDQYEVYCMECHGDKGEGEGYLHTSGLYPVKPRSLVNQVARSLEAGEIYHTITLGFGSMGSHGSQIRPDDRWSIVSYIREVLQNQNPNDISVSE